MNFSDTLTRVRPALVADPYNPDALVPDPSGAQERIQVNGFLDAETPAEVTSASRDQVTSGATFYMEDLVSDIQRGDVLEVGERRWRVVGFPPAPRNPFTGYQPYRICTLMEVRG